MLKSEIIKVADLVGKEIIARNIETEKDYNGQSEDIVDKILKLML